MKTIINTISKTNLLLACVVSCSFSVLTNSFCSEAAEMVMSNATAGTVNNVIDCLQLAGYVAVKLLRSKTLNRYDLPFITSGVLAISI